MNSSGVFDWILTLLFGSIVVRWLIAEFMEIYRDCKNFKNSLKND